jgi:hypothetical protein
MGHNMVWVSSNTYLIPRKFKDIQVAIRYCTFITLSNKVTYPSSSPTLTPTDQHSIRGVKAVISLLEAKTGIKKHRLQNEGMMYRKKKQRNNYKSS